MVRNQTGRGVMHAGGGAATRTCSVSTSSRPLCPKCGVCGRMWRHIVRPHPGTGHILRPHLGVHHIEPSVGCGATSGYRPHREATFLGYTTSSPTHPHSHTHHLVQTHITSFTHTSHHPHTHHISHPPRTPRARRVHAVAPASPLLPCRALASPPARACRTRLPRFPAATASCLSSGVPARRLEMQHRQSEPPGRSQARASVPWLRAAQRVGAAAALGPCLTDRVRQRT